MVQVAELDDRAGMGEAAGKLAVERALPNMRLKLAVRLDRGHAMRRVILLLVMTTSLASPAVAQWLGEPLWNSPTGGGLVISADYGKPNSDYGKGAAWGVRVSWGFRATTFTLGAASWAPEGSDALTSVGGTVAVRLTPSSLLPTPSPGIRANLQVGVAHTDVANLIFSPASATTVTAAVGLGAGLRASDVSVEPYVSPGIRYRSFSDGGNSTEFGYAIGANVGFGMFGVHFAYDNENIKGGGTVGVFGVGVHYAP